jgi:hypothetical protein
VIAQRFEREEDDMETKASNWLARFTRSAVLVAAVLLVAPTLALALAPVALLMAPVALFATPFLASALLGSAQTPARRPLQLRGMPRRPIMQPLPCA